MNIRSLAISTASVAVSVLLAGAFFFGWLAVFIPAFKTGEAGLQVLGWLSAPVVTSLGFATGLWLNDRLFSRGSERVLRLWLWPLIGCSVGAAVVFWFGPMLIVFGMFVVGTVSVALREVLLLRSLEERRAR